MPSTFNELLTQLKLPQHFGQEKHLNVLETWCHKNISTDKSFIEDSAARYEHYVSLAKHFLDVFLTYLPADISKKVTEFDDMNAIQYAAANGYSRFIDKIPKEHLALNVTTSDGMTPLNLSAVFNHPQTMRALLEKGANPRVPNSSSNLPIHNVLMVPSIFDEHLHSTKEAMFDALINNAPDTIDAKGDGGETVFHLMISNEFSQLFTTWAKRHPNGVFHCNHRAQYPIHTAILNNSTDIATLLLAIDKVANQADAKQHTAIHYAALYGNKEMVELCCNMTTDINSRDKALQTPLMLAANNGNLAAVQVLQQQGADPTLVDYSGRTLLHYAVLSNEPDLVEWVLDNTSVEVNKADKQGLLAIDLVDSHSPQIASTLISHGSKTAHVSVKSFNL